MAANVVASRPPTGDRLQRRRSCQNEDDTKNKDDLKNDDLKNEIILLMSITIREGLKKN